MNKHWGADDRTLLRINKLDPKTETLGPGIRTVVAVQGCNLRCKSCISTPTHDLEAGHLVGVQSLARALERFPADYGLTLTGGEPFLQAAALTALIDELRKRRTDLSVMSFSGYRIEYLLKKGSDSQRELLSRLDILVDGPYIESRHKSLLWRASDNQRIHLLSDKHVEELDGRPDTTAGVELHLTSDGYINWSGVPPIPDFLSQLEAAIS